MRPSLLHVAIALAFYLTACSPLLEKPMKPYAETAPQSADLYLLAIDEIVSGGTGPVLEELQREHPESPLTAKASALAELVRSRQNLDERIKALTRERAKLQQENTHLQGEIRLLTDDLENLRKLIIEMEMRRK
jgi:predicted RNase H-like nuclease (RuvC/YqgF family)